MWTESSSEQKEGQSFTLIPTTGRAGAEGLSERSVKGLKHLQESLSYSFPTEKQRFSACLFHCLFLRRASSTWPGSPSTQGEGQPFLCPPTGRSVLFQADTGKSWGLPAEPCR